MQLEFSQSENCKLKKDLEYLQNELQVTCILKKQVEDYKQCISCIQKDHQSMLNDAEVKVSYFPRLMITKAAPITQTSLFIAMDILQYKRNIKSSRFHYFSALERELILDIVLLG